MEDFIGFIVLIIYLFAAFSGKKKKAQKKRQKQKVGFERAFAAGAQGVQGAAPHTLIPDEPAQEYAEEPDCAQQRLHLHEVTPQQMHMAQEGDDPCHAGGATDVQIEEDRFSYDEEETREELTQDVLRGVIMSEILMRPSERMAMKRNRRSAI